MFISTIAILIGICKATKHKKSIDNEGAHVSRESIAGMLFRDGDNASSYSSLYCKMLGLKFVCTLTLICLEMIAKFWPDAKLKFHGQLINQDQRTVLDHDFRRGNFPTYILLLITLRLADMFGYLMIRKWAKNKSKIHVI